MNFLLLVLLGVTLLSIWVFYCSLRHILSKRREAYVRLAQGKRPRKFHYSITRLVMLGVLAVGSTVTLSAYCGHTLASEYRTFSSSEKFDSSSELVEYVGVPAVTQPLKSTKELFPEFRLSDVESSNLFVLTNLMVLDDSITFSLISEAEYRFEEFLERYTHPVAFFQYYENLNDFFPDGDRVKYAFDNVENREDCNDQLRGAGEQLSQAKIRKDNAKIASCSHRLAIRSLDAMGFTKYQDNGDKQSQQKRYIWLYAEIFLPSQLNSYIYSFPDNDIFFNWYYRMGQVFDYLGGVADDEDMKLKLYFVSAVFLHCSCKMIAEQDFQVSFEACDNKKWELYVEMLYRVAIRVESSKKTEFFQEIQRIEEEILSQPFPQEVLESMSDTLNSMKAYQSWRESQ